MDFEDGVVLAFVFASVAFFASGAGYSDSLSVVGSLFYVPLAAFSLLSAAVPFAVPVLVLAFLAFFSFSLNRFGVLAGAAVVGFVALLLGV